MDWLFFLYHSILHISSNYDKIFVYMFTRLKMVRKKYGLGIYYIKESKGYNKRNIY